MFDGPGDDVLQRVGRGAELAVDQRDTEAVETAAAELGGHVRRVQPGVDRAVLDLLHEIGRHLAELLDLLLVGEQLALGEGAHGVDDHLVLVGEFEIHGCSWPVSRAVRGGGRRMTLPTSGGWRQ